jgi:surface protein
MEEMFSSATSFNKDLSSWNVDNVTVCDGFSNNTPSWIQPKPNFTNCSTP